MTTHNITYAGEVCKEQKYNSENIKKAFKDFIDKPIWVVSDLNNKKLPINPKNSRNAACNDPSTWVTFKQADDFCKKKPGFAPAIVITSKLNLVCIDLDKVRDEKGIQEWAKDIVHRCATYTEVSISGSGFHIFASGKKPGKECKKKQIEIYDTDKIITVTGNVLNGHGRIEYAQIALDVVYNNTFKIEIPKNKIEQRKLSPPMSDEVILALCRKAKNESKFNQLYKGEYKGDDASSADMSLCSIFAFYTQDELQIERLLRTSTLKRDKWDTHNTYLSLTIKKVLNSLNSTFQGSNLESDSFKKASTDTTWENPSKIEEEDNLDREFPTKELPNALKTAVEEISRVHRVDPALASLPGLGITALMIGKKAVVIEKPGLKHNASLFLVGVAASGERKSSCFDALLDGIKDEIDKEIDQYNKEKAAVRAHNDLIKERIQDTKKALKEKKMGQQEAQKHLEDLYASEKRIPPDPYNFGDDITPPRLFQKLYEYGGAYGVFSSDARSVFRKILGTKDGDSGEALYLGGMWGDDLSRSRVGSNMGQVGGEDMLIRKPALTTVAFIQPDMWSELSESGRMRESGLISRINLVVPTSQMGTRLETDKDEELDATKIKCFTQTLLRIRNWKPDKQIEVSLSPGATEMRREFYNAIEIELGAGGKFEDVKDIATKATSIATRLSLIIALLDAAEHPQFKGFVPPISKEQWIRAQALEGYFLAQAIDSQRTHSKTGVVHTLQKVAVWLKKQIPQHKDCTSPLLLLASQISKGVRGTKTEIIEGKIIPALIEHNWLRKNGVARGGKSKYEVNPRIIDASL